MAFLLEKRRTDQETRDTIEREFRPDGVAGKYRALYADVMSRARHMMRGLGRALAAALLAAFGGAIGLALFYGRSPALRVDFDVTPPRGIIDGVYPSEIDPDTGRTFAWTVRR